MTTSMMHHTDRNTPRDMSSSSGRFRSTRVLYPSSMQAWDFDLLYGVWIGIWLLEPVAWKRDLWLWQFAAVVVLSAASAVIGGATLGW